MLGSFGKSLGTQNSKNESALIDEGLFKSDEAKPPDLAMIVVSSWSSSKAAPSFQMANGDLTIFNSFNHAHGVTIRAADGQIGKADQFYFDDAA